MCQDNGFEVSVDESGLKKILVNLKAGKYPFDQDSTPYNIARETLNKVFEGTGERAGFNTALRFEEMLIKDRIGKVSQQRPLQMRRHRPHREIAA